MTRENLIDMVYSNEELWSCPVSIKCESNKEEATEEACRACAERQVAEYEKSIKNNTIDDIINKIDEEYYDGGYGDYHEVEKIVKLLENMRGE